MTNSYLLIRAYFNLSYLNLSIKYLGTHTSYFNTAIIRCSNKCIVNSYCVAWYPKQFNVSLFLHLNLYITKTINCEADLLAI